jgi:hypothetical protein
MFKDIKVIGTNISMDVYRRQDPNVKRGDPGFIMSRGELVSFAECPFKWIESTEKETSKSLDWGTLMDTLILTPERFEKEFAVQPATYKATGMECPSCGSITDSAKCSKCKCDRHAIEIEKEWNENSTICTKWTEDVNKKGMTVVKAKVYEQAQVALKMFQRDQRLVDLVECSKKQMMIVATYVDRATGIEVPLKILLDLVPDASHPDYGKTLADLKTARSAEFRSWESSVAENGYDVQAALYSDLYRAAFPKEDRTDWRFVIQENTPPYITGRRTLSGTMDDITTTSFMQIGRMKYQAALKDYCVCLATGYWPSYDDLPKSYNGWTVVEPKEWMVSQVFGLGLRLPKSAPVEQEERVDFMN